ncbi:MAG: MFS transporter [Chloroflexota bacterium]|nr:MFS transporter [Chloroflexota bacterium]
MKPKSSRYRWFVVAVFFAFMLLHQADKLLIGPLTTPIMETFGIDEAQMGAVSTGALVVGAILYPLWGYLYDRPLENQTLFMVMLSISSLFIPFAAPNVISTVYDVTLPEVRSTAMAIQYFIESAGAALSPLLAGLIAVNTSLKDAILIICTSAWVLCAIFFFFTAYLIPQDIQTLRDQLRLRAEAASLPLSTTAEAAALPLSTTTEQKRACRK